MKIETLEVAGFIGLINGLRLPYGNKKSVLYTNKTEVKPDFVNYYSIAYIDESDIKLASTLVKRGDSHAKALRSLIVYTKISAPIYWWCELETYRAGHERVSSESTMHIDCRRLTGDELVSAKAAIPMGKELTKVDYFSYQALRNIALQREGHRLPEWKEFIEWIKTLPYAKELIFADK